jgi:hypothetical protein
MDNVKSQESINETKFTGVLKHFVRHPLETMVSGWHWKAALFSALFRTPVFLIAYHNKGFGIALAAGLIQFVFRTVFGGIGGSIIQKFSKVEPAWHTIITVPVALTIITHIFEFMIQIAFDRYNGTDMAQKAIIASITISVMSAVFNLFVMRRGVLLVKDEKQQTIWKDFSYIPRLLFDFVTIPPNQLLLQKQYFLSILVAASTSLGTGIIAAILRRKISWGFWTGGIVLALTIIAVGVIFISARKYKEIEALGDY